MQHEVIRAQQGITNFKAVGQKAIIIQFKVEFRNLRRGFDKEHKKFNQNSRPLEVPGC